MYYVVYIFFEELCTGLFGKLVRAIVEYDTVFWRIRIITDRGLHKRISFARRIRSKNATHDQTRHPPVLEPRTSFLFCCACAFCSSVFPLSVAEIPALRPLLRPPSSAPLHTAHCTLHPAHCTLHTAHCTLHTAHCTLHTAHRTLHL
jgi:hypothetical protein